MDNQASAVIIEIPIGDSLDNAEFLNKIKEEVNNTAKNLNLVYAIKFINNFGNYFLPRYIWDFMINDTLKDVDIQFSNIAGPSKPIYIGGSEVKDISFVTPIGKHRIFMGVHSYKGEYFINFNADSSIDCDVDKLVDLIDEVLEKI